MASLLIRLLAAWRETLDDGAAREEVEWCVRNAKKRYEGRAVRFVASPLVDLTRPPMPF